MSNLFSKDITLKIISVVFAVILWFFVLGDVNPVQKTDIVVPLVFENRYALDMKSLGIKSQIIQRDVVVTVEDRSQRLKTINANDLTAVVDYSAVQGPGIVDLDVKVKTLKEGIRIRQVVPSSVRISFEGNVEKAFNIDVKSEVNMKENYKIVRTSVIPQAIKVSGLESMISSISSVKAFVKDISGLDKDLVMKTDCYFYNQKGDELYDLSKKYYVDIKLEVAKEVSVVINKSGRPANDYYETGTSISPERVLITGSPEILNQITELRTEMLNIESANSNVVQKRRIILPEGVKLFEAPAEADLSVLISKMPVREYPVLKGNIELVGASTDLSYKYEIVPDQVILKLIGTPTDHESILLSELKPQINVSKLKEGNHKVPLKVTLPTNIKLVEEPSVEINITVEKKPSPTPT